MMKQSTIKCRFVERIRAIKCGNRSINNQMKYLPDNVVVLRSIEAEYGSLETFVIFARHMR